MVKPSSGWDAESIKCMQEPLVKTKTWVILIYNVTWPKHPWKPGSDGGSDGGFSSSQGSLRKWPQKPRGWGLMCGIFLGSLTLQSKNKRPVEIRCSFLMIPFFPWLTTRPRIKMVTKVWGHRKQPLPLVPTNPKLEEIEHSQPSCLRQQSKVYVCTGHKTCRYFGVGFHCYPSFSSHIVDVWRSWTLWC